MGTRKNIIYGQASAADELSAPTLRVYVASTFMSPKKTSKRSSNLHRVVGDCLDIEQTQARHLQAMFFWDDGVYPAGIIEVQRITRRGRNTRGPRSRETCHSTAGSMLSAPGYVRGCAPLPLAHADYLSFFGEESRSTRGNATTAHRGHASRPVVLSNPDTGGPSGKIPPAILH